MQAKACGYRIIRIVKAETEYKGSHSCRQEQASCRSMHRGLLLSFLTLADDVAIFAGRFVVAGLEIA